MQRKECHSSAAIMPPAARLQMAPDFYRRNDLPPPRFNDPVQATSTREEMITNFRDIRARIREFISLTFSYPIARTPE
ncbi:MAG TPA: hypothetical protein VEG44_10905 [Candidatus Acidoferrales bacterium]|nr:hypothetical protein [Candidatus Acidoferrales bacterium]